MKKIFLLVVSMCFLVVPNLMASDDFIVIFDQLTFGFITVDKSEIPFFQGKKIQLPDMNFSVKTKPINIKPTDPNLKIYMEVGFKGDIFQSPSLRSSASEEMTAIPEDSEFKNKIAPKQKEIQITHKAPILTPVLRTTSAGAKAQHTIYASDESEYITVPLDVNGESGPYSFKWLGLLSNEKRSISRENHIPVYIVSTESPSGYEFEVTLPTQLFKPSLIWLDAADPGKETFSTINTYPVTDAMVVYVKETGSPGNFSEKYSYMETQIYFVKELDADLADLIINMYEWQYTFEPSLKNSLARIITALPENSIYKDGHDPRVVDDPAFGAYDSYQNTGKEVKLSMSTKGLEEGWYSRYILWRRGFKDTDGQIKGVDYFDYTHEADVYAVQDYVYVDNPSNIQAISADDNPVTVYDGMGNKIIQGQESDILPALEKGSLYIFKQNGKAEKRIYR